MTNGNDSIENTTYRQVGDNDFIIATEKHIREGIYLTSRVGLTKREHFAAMAMQGFIASANLKKETIISKIKRFLGINGWHTEWQISGSSFSKASVEMADELINALNETK